MAIHIPTIHKVIPVLFHREKELINVSIFTGPTNSGKTFNALKKIFEDYEASNGKGVFVYAGPLRMLAYEVYEKMVAKYGEENVGFLTGEEQINPTAPLLACTIEMAPKKGTSLIMDETHWMIDEDRGQHWTQMLTNSSYENMYILAAYEALGTVMSLVEDAHHIELISLTRKTPLNYSGTTQLLSIPPKTAVVAFSRKKVYEIAHALAQGGKKVGVLYGSLPLQTRNQQIQRYIKGEYDIMVTTDVIGHGINLPIDNVVFAQTDKYDGNHMRNLHTWELAQIAGRAGRFGLSDEGRVFLLDNSVIQKNFYPNEFLLREGVLAGNGSKPTDLVTDYAYVSPQLSELGITTPNELLTGLEEWSHIITREYSERHIAPSPLTTLKTLLCKIAEYYEAPLEASETGSWGITLETLWKLISGPFNPKSETILRVAQWLLEPDIHSSYLLEKYVQSKVIPALYEPLKYTEEVGAELKPLEAALEILGELKMVNIMFHTTGSLLYSELLEYETLISDRLSLEVYRTIMEKTCRHNKKSLKKKTQTKSVKRTSLIR
jgi:ATP-dependent RNA helicase SUPV3L1/SUV3